MIWCGGEELTKQFLCYRNIDIICIIIFIFSAVDNGAMQLSPIFFGVLLTILILISYCVVRILWKRTQQHKPDDVIDGSKQSSSLLCTSVVGNTNGTVNNANHTDTITKVRVILHSLHRLLLSFFFFLKRRSNKVNGFWRFVFWFVRFDNNNKYWNEVMLHTYTHKPISQHTLTDLNVCCVFNAYAGIAFWYALHLFHPKYRLFILAYVALFFPTNNITIVQPSYYSCSQFCNKQTGHGKI